MPRNSKKSAPPGYLTATQAMELIGVQRSTFYNMVENNSIKKEVPPGHKEGVYSERAIREFARHYKTFMQQSVRFELALPDDIEPIRAMVARENNNDYGHTVPADVMAAWMRLNNRSIYVLRRVNEIVGYVSLFPLDEETMIKRMTGEYWNRSIPLEAIQQFIPNTSIKLYIAEMAVNQSLPDHAKLAARLVLETRSLLVKMSTEDHITIEQIYAVATTAFGVTVCQKLQMEPMTYLPAGVRPADNRIPFKMDVASNQSRLFGRYREQIAR